MTNATEPVTFDLHFHTHEQLVDLACASATFLAHTGDQWGFTLATATLNSVADELAARG